MKQKRGSRGHSSSPLSMMDRNLLPRIEDYAMNSDHNDIDELVGHLRTCYKEYQRMKLGPFHQMVRKAIGILERRGGPVKPELKLRGAQQDHVTRPAVVPAQTQTRTPAPGSFYSEPESDGAPTGATRAAKRHKPELTRVQAPAPFGAPSHAPGTSSLKVAARAEGGGRASNDGGIRSGSSSGQESDSGGGSKVSDEEAAAKTGPRRPGLNSSLLRMYSRAETDAAALERSGSETPAFAPPHVVAAAAMRALAAEKATRLGAKVHAEQEAAGDKNGPSTSDKSALASTPCAGLTVPPTPHAGTGAVSPASSQRQLQAVGTPTGAALEAAAVAPVASAGGQPTLQKAGTRERAAQRRRRSAAGSGGGGGGRANRGLLGGGGLEKHGSAVVEARAVRYADLGGLEDVLRAVREVVEYPLRHPEVYAWLGLEPPRGVLLHGPPGCGKTALAHAIATECGVPFLKLSAPEVVSGMSGESEAKLRGLFAEAADVAPAIIFIDEIDAIATKRESAQREMERRIVAQLLTCMDDLAAPPAQQQGGAGQQQQRGEGQDANDDEAVFVPSRGHVVVIGATNRPDAMDPALRRAGRFDREIALSIPSEAGRRAILRVITQRLRLEGNFNFDRVAKKTPGFVGADLMALAKEAAAVAVTRAFCHLEQRDTPPTALQAPHLSIADRPLSQAGAQDASAQHAAAAPLGSPGPTTPAAAASPSTAAGPIAGIGDHSAAAPHGAGLAAATPLQRFGQGPLSARELQGLAITSADFDAALAVVQPSVRREGFTTTPGVTWSDVGALAEVREELSFSVTLPIAHPERFEALGLAAATGVLLYGPPGCGKTLLAKAVANESGANFISIKGPELLNKWVGESERAVRQLFARARSAHPCVLFFDELDALAPRRGQDANQAAERVVNQLLTEMDGIGGRHGVYIIAATNRPDMIDPALLRPGRLDKALYVPLPPPEGRVSILRALVRRTPLADDVDLHAVGMDARCNGFSGADLAALVREACVLALKQDMASPVAARNTRLGPSPDSLSATTTSTVSATPVVGPIGSAATEAGSGAAALMVRAKHFWLALPRVTPSVSSRDQRLYDSLRGASLRAARGLLSGPAEDATAAKVYTPPHSDTGTEGVAK